METVTVVATDTKGECGASYPNFSRGDDDEDGACSGDGDELSHEVRFEGEGTARKS